MTPRDRVEHAVERAGELMADKMAEVKPKLRGWLHAGTAPVAWTPPASPASAAYRFRAAHRRPPARPAPRDHWAAPQALVPVAAAAARSRRQSGLDRWSLRAVAAVPG